MPKIPVTASPAGKGLITAEEGHKLTAYLDAAGNPTIGTGHLLLPKYDYKLFGLTAAGLDAFLGVIKAAGRMTNKTSAVLTITEQQADDLLDKDIAQVCLFIRSTCQVDLNQNQLDALLSLIFNIGQGNYATSTIKKSLAAGDYTAAANAFLLWDKITIDGRKISDPVLQKRRAQERALFLTPV